MLLDSKTKTPLRTCPILDLQQWSTGNGKGTIQYDTIRYDTIRYDTIRYDTIRYDTIRYDTIRYDTIRYDTIRYDTIRYDTIRYDTMQYNMVYFQHNTITSQQQFLPNIGMVGKGVDRRIILSWSTPNID